MFRHLLCAAVLCAMTMPALAGGKLYRFKVDGRVVIKDSVPAELAPLGYEVLNSQGAVLQVVPRELTPAEISERDRQIEEQRQRDKRIARRKAEDEALVRLYAGPDDVDRALKRKTDDVQAHIDLQERRRAESQEKLEAAQQRAANIERQGKEVTPEMKLDIVQLGKAVEDARQKISQRQEEKQRLTDEYAATRRRIELLQHYPMGTLPEDIAGSDQ